jgi:hypothetical protein
MGSRWDMCWERGREKGLRRRLKQSWGNEAPAKKAKSEHKDRF